MGERITVVGGTDSAIAVTLDGAQAKDLAKEFVNELNSYYQDSKLNFLSVTDSPSVIDGEIGYGVITQGGAYSAGNGYNYIVVGGYNATNGNPLDPQYAVDQSTANFLDAPVTINSVMNSSQYVRVVAGNLGGFEYNASLESGVLAAGNVQSNIVFNGNATASDTTTWSINTGKGDDTIVTGAGNNTVNASTGKNKITITDGNRNSVRSEGQDTIYASADSSAKNSVTLLGGSSTVEINNGASVTDGSSYNVVTVGGGSTIAGGTSGTYKFDGSSDSNLNTLTDGLSNTVTATGDLLAVHGNANNFNATKSFTLLNGIGETSALVKGQVIGFGADGLNYTLNASGDSSGLFVADAGNETLNASGSTSALQIYANTIVGGGGTSFVATGGEGNDTLVAGTGNSTFSGGGGDNLFQFTKDTADDGKTVITDFASSSQNKIALYNYGLDSNSLAELLKNSQNDSNGNAVLNLTGHTITIEGVSVSDLTVNQFEVANASTTKSS